MAAGIVVVASSGNLGAELRLLRARERSVRDHRRRVRRERHACDTATTSSRASRPTASPTTASSKPEIVATGRHIVSNLPAGSLLDCQAPAANHVEPGYLMANGTSFAAPQVAGAAALLLQRNPEPDSRTRSSGSSPTTGRSVAGSDAPGLDIAAALAFNGTAQSANQGIASSTGSPGSGPGSAA